MLRVLRIASVCLLATSVVLATEPDPEALDRAHARSQEAMEQARRLGRDADFNRRMRDDGEQALSAAGQASRDTVPAFDGTRIPDVDAETLTKAQRDIAALMTAPWNSEPAEPPTSDDPLPLVFISFSMPEASLRSLLTEAAQTGSPLVLHGMVENSMKRTAERLGELLDPAGTGRVAEPAPSLAIDPTLFERFGVDKVPTFLLPRDSIPPCTPDGCTAPEHLKLAGDVSLAYALGVMARNADDTELGRRAEQWRQRLEAP